MSSSAGKENVFAAVIEFVKQVDDIHSQVFLPTRQQKAIVLKEQAHLAIRDLDAIPIVLEKRQSKEDHAMYLYLRGKLLIVTSGYNQEAAQHLTNALKLKKNIVDAWICLGTCVWERGHLDKAKICYKCGLEQDPNNKEILHHLSAVGRKLCEGETDVENQEEIISESIKHAKDAIGQDVHDGLSWYILGNACLTAYFLTGTGDHDMLFQSLKAYKNAAKDKKMQESIELCYNSSMTYMFLENYWMALVGFERAGLMDPTCKSLRQTLNLRDVLDNIDSLLKKMNDAKGIPSPTSSLASVELDPSYERATVDRLTEGLNEGKTVTGKVLFSVENRSKGPIYYIVCDYNRNCFVITIYGVRRTAIKEEDQVTLLDPFYHYFDFEWKGKQYQFNSVRVDLLRQLCVNGAIVSPEHAIHRSMYTEFMEG
ncbi:hypothetical protein RND71_036713 [Anisodus tanguticus]|uniref:Tetratricopeptide repeat protein 5 OB fold domain-containing protein n=1 Tax=Anisodus tanguticus TaxID=243964 RepID=A0AAE1R110_9SOLA|nr:hypothetical protein RND71_036713 [Anisodus tanguticus]